MRTTRLEAFTDAVIAIAMTILVLGLSSPEESSFSALWALRHSFAVYLISFATLAIYWVNHHHLFQAAKTVSGSVLWWNIALLFCISLFPFTTVWIGADLFSQAAAIAYGALMLTADVVWFFLGRSLVHAHGKGSALISYLQNSKKSIRTIAVIGLGLIVGWYWPPAVMLGCLTSLLLWVVPDKNIEKFMREAKAPK
ncbi:MAG: TMEM175 family protein [Coriobacteriia bacterium]|nr:TMEM175 family protein [Coriobacteriia bacterium]MCL2871168.1 TMEM175 family protein [Coriobacteriia bacterium]